MATSTASAQTTARAASWRNLGLVYVAGVILSTLASIGYHVHTHKNSLASDIPFYAVSGLVFLVVAAVALLVVHRSRSAALPARVGIVLGALAIVVFPVAYYMPVSVIWGGTAFLLSRDADAGRSAAAARWLGMVAVLLAVAWVVARWAGVTYQVGG